MRNKYRLIFFLKKEKKCTTLFKFCYSKLKIGTIIINSKKK